MHVRSADGLASPDDGLLERHRALLYQLDGRYVEVVGADPADALVRFARAENATQIIMGSSHRSRWAELTQGSVINQVIRAAGPIDVHVISANDRPAPRAAMRPRALRPLAPRSARSTALAWIGALVGIPLLVLALIPLRDAMGVPGTLLLLLVGPVAVAVLGGLLPAIAASLVTFLLADWFYIAPRNSLRFAHAGDALALVVFVAVVGAGERPRGPPSEPERTAGTGPGRDRGAGRAGVRDGGARRRGAASTGHRAAPEP